MGKRDGKKRIAEIAENLLVRWEQAPTKKTALEKNDRQGVSSVFFFGVILALVYLESKRQVPSTKGGELGYSLTHAHGAALDNRAPAEVYPNRN